MKAETSLPATDQQAIGDTLRTLMAGFARRDAEQLLTVYAEDADWVNAFGSVKKGRNVIVSYLRGLFADDNFNAGKMTAAPEISVRVVTPEVVVVSGHLKVAGQKLIGGGVIEERDNYSIRVMQRHDDGRWLIVSEMFMDANQTQTYAGHS